MRVDGSSGVCHDGDRHCLKRLRLLRVKRRNFLFLLNLVDNGGGFKLDLRLSYGN